MVPGVKGGSPLRAEQAAETRRRILAAAAAVIIEQGFAGARIGDVAARAAVAAPTVYKIFSNKRNLLMGALTAAMTGTDTSAIDTQAWWAEQLQEPDAARQLRLIARNARRIYERAGALLEALRAAAPADTELAAAWHNITSERLDRSRRSASALAAKPGQRPRLSTDDTALTLWSLTGPELFAAYTSTGKSPAQYERWLADILCRTLID